MNAFEHVGIVFSELEDAALELERAGELLLFAARIVVLRLVEVEVVVGIVKRNTQCAVAHERVLEDVDVVFFTVAVMVVVSRRISTRARDFERRVLVEDNRAVDAKRIKALQLDMRAVELDVAEETLVRRLNRQVRIGAVAIALDDELHVVATLEGAGNDAVRIRAGAVNREDGLLARRAASLMSKHEGRARIDHERADGFRAANLRGRAGDVVAFAARRDAQHRRIAERAAVRARDELGARPNGRFAFVSVLAREANRAVGDCKATLAGHRDRKFVVNAFVALKLERLEFVDVDGGQTVGEVDAAAVRRERVVVGASRNNIGVARVVIDANAELAVDIIDIFALDHIKCQSVFFTAFNVRAGNKIRENAIACVTNDIGSCERKIRHGFLSIADHVSVYVVAHVHAHGDVTVHFNGAALEVDVALLRIVAGHARGGTTLEGEGRAVVEREVRDLVGADRMRDEHFGAAAENEIRALEDRHPRVALSNRNGNLELGVFNFERAFDRRGEIAEDEAAAVVGRNRELGIVLHRHEVTEDGIRFFAASKRQIKRRSIGNAELAAVTGNLFAAETDGRPVCDVDGRIAVAGERVRHRAGRARNVHGRARKLRRTRAERTGIVDVGRAAEFDRAGKT